jgi:predicted cobalt transporter CbtA
MGHYALGTILKAALLAGLAAGLTVALFHAVATEPVIDRAIALEEERAPADQHEEPIVSRQAQKGGLFLGFVVYGLTWASFLGLAYHLVQRSLPATGARRQRLLLAAAAYWAVGLLPFLKYPANPPGVGDPETIGYRQALYVGFLVLSVAGTALAFVLSQRLIRASSSGFTRGLLTAALVGAFSLIVYLAMPANPDSVELPAEVVTSFRALSLVGLTLFWTVLGLLFAMLLKPEPEPEPVVATSVR